MRREQKRQDYENRNLGNYSRLFPKNEKTEMDYYLNILNTAFNLFYPVGKHLQWRKTYEKIKVCLKVSISQLSCILFLNCVCICVL